MEDIITEKKQGCRGENCRLKNNIYGWERDAIESADMNFSNLGII